MRYKTYWWFCSDNEGRGIREFSAQDYAAMNASDKDGMTETQALKIVNLWNKGTHHRYRYWIEN